MHFKPNLPAVAADTIEGETVILHHGTGTYFDGSGSATLLWTAIESGADAESLSKLLQAAYGVDAASAFTAADTFLTFLKTHDLVSDHPGSPAPFAFQGPQSPYSTPEFSVHTDLTDMLLLDPIHDVGEAGWPAPKPIAKADG